MRWRSDGAIKFPGDTGDARHELRVAVGELVFAVVDIVLEADTRVTAHGQGDGCQCQLVPAYARYAPGAAGRQAAHHMREMSGISAETTGNSHHKVELHGVGN